MRTLTIFTPVVLGLALSACSTASGPNRYDTDLQKLTEECRARGGILAPTGGQSSSPRTDNVCEIRGQPARAPSNPG